MRDTERLVARVFGACLLDPRGGALYRVDGNRVVGRHREEVGVFRKQPRLQIEGETVSVDEVFVFPDGTSTAVAANGALYLTPVAGPPFSVPGQIEGEVARARRTALLLWAFVPSADDVAAGR